MPSVTLGKVFASVLGPLPSAHSESSDHLFFTYPIARVIWVVIAKGIGANNIPTSLSQCCIDGKVIKNPIEILCHAGGH